MAMAKVIDLLQVPSFSRTSLRIAGSKTQFSPFKITLEPDPGKKVRD